ncbi:MAG: Sec-independent protein translocase TatB [Sulfurovum sp.]|nr:MAG: Sec-independent protein translocase TatB [Sulfurovum sp.]
MFGIGFTELLLIAIIAILFLGPDKLPETMIQIAKFIKSVKKTIGEAKASLEEEMKIADLKEEALNYKKQLDEATDELRNFKNIELDDLNEIVYDTPVKPATPAKDPYVQAPREITEETTEPEIEHKRETVTFKKKKSDQNPGKHNEKDSPETKTEKSTDKNEGH